MGTGQHKNWNIPGESAARILLLFLCFFKVAQAAGLWVRSLRAGLPREHLHTIHAGPLWNTAHLGHPPLPVCHPSPCHYTVSFGTPEHCNYSRHSKHQLETCKSKVWSSCSLTWTETSEGPLQHRSHLEGCHTYAFSWAASSALETFL